MVRSAVGSLLSRAGEETRGVLWMLLGEEEEEDTSLTKISVRAGRWEAQKIAK